MAQYTRQLNINISQEYDSRLNELMELTGKSTRELILDAIDTLYESETRPGVPAKGKEGKGK